MVDPVGYCWTHDAMLDVCRDRHPNGARLTDEGFAYRKEMADIVRRVLLSNDTRADEANGDEMHGRLSTLLAAMGIRVVVR